MSEYSINDNLNTMSTPLDPGVLLPRTNKCVTGSRSGGPCQVDRIWPLRLQTHFSGQSTFKEPSCIGKCLIWNCKGKLGVLSDVTYVCPINRSKLFSLLDLNLSILLKGSQSFVSVSRTPRRSWLTADLGIESTSPGSPGSWSRSGWRWSGPSPQSPKVIEVSLWSLRQDGVLWSFVDGKFCFISPFFSFFSFGYRSVSGF